MLVNSYFKRLVPNATLASLLQEGYLLSTSIDGDRKASSEPKYKNGLVIVDDYIQHDGLKVHNRSRRVNAMPTISYTLLKFVYSKAKDAQYRGITNKRVFDLISRLYKSGLGLPHDERMSLVWYNFSNGMQTKFDVVVDYNSAVQVLKAHIKKAKDLSIDGIVCQSPILIDAYTNIVNSMNKYYNTSGNKIYLPSLRGARLTVKYALTSGSTYAPIEVFIHYKKHGIPLGACVNSINTFAQITLPKKLTPHIVITGYLAIPDKNLNKLANYRPEITSTTDAIKQLVLEDVFGHALHGKDSYSKVLDKEALAERVSKRVERAREVIADKTADKDTKRKAKLLVGAFEEGNKLWKRLALKHHLKFIPFDIFRLRGDEVTPVRASYANVNKILSGLFEETLAYSDNKTVNMKGYETTGTINRTS